MNILLVEDEPPILREIKAIIESFQEDYHIVSTATNGQAAIDYLTKHHKNIDVLITDLHIPVIDGLDLLKFVSENMPHILTMILTGYSKFEYAKKAIAYGVFDYLLKPIDEDALRTQLKEAYSKLCLNYFKESSAALESAPITETKTECMTSGYQLAVICVGTFPLQLTSVDSASRELWDQIDLETVLKNNTTLIDNYWIINGAIPSEKNILFSFPSVNKEEIQNYFINLFAPFMTGPVTVTVAIDNEFHGVHTVHSSVQKLRVFLNKNVRLEKSQILYFGEDSITKKDLDLSLFRRYHTRLTELFQQKNISLFKAELKNCLQKMKQTAMRQFDMFTFLYDLITACIEPSRDIPAIKQVDIYASVTDIIMLSDTYEALYENLLSIFDSFFEAMIKEMVYTDSRQDTLIKIDSFLKENFTKSINIKQLADQYGFTPAYLSKIFREYKHITPTDYIMSLRIEKAKQLMQTDSTCKIKDIAGFVGYEDSLYFSKVFKKTTGLSPKQYIESV